MAFSNRATADVPDKTHTSLDVVLRCFVAAAQADSGMLLGFADDNKSHLLSATGHAARYATVPWTPRSFLGQASRAEGVSLEPASGWHSQSGAPSAWHAVACPIRGSSRALGTIYASWERPSHLGRGELIWLAKTHAQLAGLCMSEGGGAVAAVLRSSGVDQLTGCLRYERVIEMLKSEVQRSTRQGHDLSCCFFDIDHFKAINDEHGHLEGNRVLTSAGDALNASARGFDCVGRFGGDEFVVVMPETALAEAHRAADRMRLALKNAVEAKTGLKVTTSTGVAQWKRKDTMLQLLEASDRALQADKAAGDSHVRPARQPGGLRGLARFGSFKVAPRARRRR